MNHVNLVCPHCKKEFQKKLKFYNSSNKRKEQIIKKILDIIVNIINNKISSS